MEEVTVKGFILSTVFRNEANGYTIASMKTNDGLLVKVAGVMSSYSDWTPLWIIGNKKPNTDLIDIMTISENSIGVDNRIKDKFLTEAGMTRTNVKKLLEDSSNLFDVLRSGSFKKRIGEAERDVVSKILLPVYQREFREYIQSVIPKEVPKEDKVNISYTLMNKYAARNKANAINNFKRNVYEVAIHSLGCSFDEADSIAKNITDDDAASNRIARRVMSLASYEMARAERSGHTCQKIKDLGEVIQHALFSKEDKNASKTSIEHVLQGSPGLIVRNGMVATVTSHQNETMAAANIKRLMAGKTAFTKEEIEASIESIERTTGISYAPAQKQAFRLLMSPVGVLTGGPGTGKTTTILGLIKCYMRKYPLNEIKLCSPTGRAAQRMTETTNMEAMTIHRLFGIGKANRGEKVSGDLFVIDEASMLDAEMASWLFSSIPDGSQVILIGDIDQLPSVGPGNILKDLITSQVIPVCRLETVYRQSGESPIVTNANLINKGKTELVTNQSFEIVECQSDLEIMDEMLKTVKEAMRTVHTVFDFQVLDTSHKGDAGIAAVNKQLQDLINPKKAKTDTIRYGNTEFRVGDKVITTQNNYKDGYFNGDIGEIIAINREHVIVNVLGREIKVQRANIGDLSLAYCISIHKSQGSEFAHCIILLPEKPPVMLKRNLLYTAVTRGKSKVTIVAGKGCIDKCCGTIDNQQRLTSLKTLLCG